jgi:hypothetical protein
MQSTASAIVAIGVGCIMGMIALRAKHFYWRKGWNSGDKEAPRWVGRLLFGVIGGLFLLFGLRHILFGF